MQPKFRTAGFSVIELTVVVAIVALLAGLATPSLITWQRSRRLNGAVMNLIADFEVAKMRAVRENSFVVMLFRTDGYTIFVDNGAGSGDPGDWVRSGDEPLVQARTLPAGVEIPLADLTLADHRVRFNGRGFPLDVAAAETIPVFNEYGRRTITLTRLGNVRAN